MRNVYDSIYRNHRDVWVDQGRSEHFLRYLSNFIRSESDRRILEIGCGEGALLSTISAAQKFGIDPSITALQRAKSRSSAELSVARAEELPFQSNFFDVVIAVGVMEHFEDPLAATREIHRVLSPSGRYVTLIQADMSVRERLFLKAREYFYPRFAPLEALRWAVKKIHKPIVQPFRRSYTIDGARACLESSGLQVTDVITLATQPAAPLAGPHVFILDACKNAS